MKTRSGKNFELVAWVALSVSLFAPGCSARPPAGEATGTRNFLQRICPDGDTVEGIDVSRYQGVIDWVSVAQSGRAFAITRVSDGTRFPDAQFARNWSMIPARGLVRGLYQFFRAGQDPIAQADLMLNMTAADPVSYGDLPPVMDIETADGQATSVVRANMQTWLDYVQAATGMVPIIYTANFMSSIIGTGFAGYPLWVANWGATCPLMPTGWTSWIVWQYSSTGSVPGISGNVDLDRFNGGIGDLYAYVSPPAGTSEPTGPVVEDDLSQPAGNAMGDCSRGMRGCAAEE